MGQLLTVDDVKDVIEKILARVERIIDAGRREEILNERFFHHMFSWEVGKLWESRSGGGGGDFWDALYLRPEPKTAVKFSRKNIILAHADATNSERCGNMDFAINSCPPISVEWKGPKLYSQRSAYEVLFKLLNEPPESVKVFAAIMTSCSGRGGRGHLAAAKTYLERATNDVRRRVGASDFGTRNLHVFIASVAGQKIEKVHWGQLL